MKEKSLGARRRDLLKGSLLIGGAAAMGAANSAQASNDAKPPAGTASAPSAAAAHAETGPVGQNTTSGGDLSTGVHRPGSDYMVDLLKAAGVKYVAATPGSTFRGLHESIVNYGDGTPKLIVCPHEEISAAIAHGYAKVAGRPMACMVHSNVGLQHASMAIYNAWCDRVPMMVIAGNVADATKRRPGVEWLHAGQDLGAMVRSFVKWDDAPVSLSQFGESFMRGMQLSMTPPYEPVLLVTDAELQEEDMGPNGSPRIPALAETKPPAADSTSLARAAEMLAGAARPVIVVERLARTPRGVSLLVELAELLNAPVIDLGGRMNMPNTHYLCQTGRYGPLVRNADVILGLEVSDMWGVANTVPDTPERTAKRVAAANCKVIAISANYGFMHSDVQDMQRYFEADLMLAADGEASLPQLISAVRAAGHRSGDRGRKAELQAQFARMREADAQAATIGWDASPVSTARLSMELWERIKTLNWALAAPTGFVSSWPQRLWDITQHYQYSGGAGGYGMGYGLAASIGAALAHQEEGRFSVAIQTDGDVLTLPSALWTLAHHDIPILTVMHNNRAWHQESMHLLRMANLRNRGAGNWKIGTVIEDPNIDYAAIARGMGVWAEEPISDPKELGGALDRAIAVVMSGKPALLDVVTQPR